MNSYRIPRVSIGMPVYNGARSIRQSLGALLSQTFPNFELIISDNASTDTTDQICQEYARKDQRIRYIRQTKNLGALLNFDFVLHAAHGDYFMWAACDDWWDKTFIEKCVAQLDAYIDYGLVFTEYISMSHLFGHSLFTKTFPHFDLSSEDQFARICKYVMLDESSQKANFIYGVWRTDLISRVMGEFTDLFGKHDYAGLDLGILLYALTLTKFYQLPEKLFHKNYSSILIPATKPSIAWVRFQAYIKKPYSKPPQKQNLDATENFINLLKYALEKADLVNLPIYQDMLSKKRIALTQRKFI